MSPLLRNLCNAVRAAFGQVAPMLAASLVVLSAGQAWAASSAVWAPMCDLDAASVVAPLIAPPVDSGEITVCPDGTVLRDAVLLDFEQERLLQGGAPAGDPEPGLQLDAPVPRVLPTGAFVAQRFVGTFDLLDWPDVQVGPAVAFGRVPERPPCT